MDTNVTSPFLRAGTPEPRPGSALSRNYLYYGKNHLFPEKTAAHLKKSGCLIVYKKKAYRDSVKLLLPKSSTPLQLDPRR